MSKELLFSVTKDDFIIETYKGSGPGGQHRNKVETAVRIRHPESGAVGESQSERSQYINKKLAFQRLVSSPKFKTWINRKYDEIIKGKTLEQQVNEMMNVDNIKIEIINEQGRWEEISWEEVTLND